jgi:hypothetical protein
MVKKFGRFLLTMRDSFRRPFTTKTAVWNLTFWTLYGNFMVFMLIMNKVMGTATWFTFWMNLAGLIMAVTFVFWGITGVRYRLFIRDYRKKLDPVVKEAMGPEHGVANLRFSYYRQHTWIAECSCGCGAEFMIDNDKGGIFIASMEPFGPHLKSEHGTLDG